MGEIEPPAIAFDSADGAEVCRVWVADGGTHVSLNYGVFAGDELRIWGMLLADVMAHVVRASMLSGQTNATEAFALIEAGFRHRLSNNPTTTGNFAGRTFQ